MRVRARVAGWLAGIVGVFLEFRGIDYNLVSLERKFIFKSKYPTHLRIGGGLGWGWVGSPPDAPMHGSPGEAYCSMTKPPHYIGVGVPIQK